MAMVTTNRAMNPMLALRFQEIPQWTGLDVLTPMVMDTPMPIFLGALTWEAMPSRTILPNG